MRKKFIIVLVCTFITTVVVGCGGNAQLPKPTVKVTATATATPTEKKSNVAVTGSSWELLLTGYSSDPLNNAVFHDLDNYIVVGPQGSISLSTNDTVNKPLNATASLYGIAYATDSVIYVCGSQGQVLKSINKGHTFSQAAKFGDSEPYQCQLLSFCDENNGIIASQKQMAVTNDGAKKWTKVTVPSEILSIYMLSPNVFYYVDKSLNLQKTEDAGKTWSESPMEFYQKENTLKEIGKIALYVEKDNTYTIFCAQNIDGKFGKLKCYSTADNWESFMINVIPNTSFQIDWININHTGDIATITNSSGYDIICKEKNDAELK